MCIRDRILEVRKHLPRYDWLVFIDVDTLIMNPAVRLEDVADDSVDQVLAADHNGVNSGVWMVRNTPCRSPSWTSSGRRTTW